jgi:NAD(P)-dependent dehydrogenase (short-subunit alcohol dehydrogenase family)
VAHPGAVADYPASDALSQWQRTIDAGGGDNGMDRNWLVTGGSAGLGRAIAMAAVTAGDTVVATVRTVEDARNFETDVQGGRAVVADLVKDKAQDIVAEARHRLGQIDVLVNNAGSGFTGAVEEASEEEIRAVFDLNFFAQVAMIQAVLPCMRARRSGHIVNITSISGFKPWSGTGIYCASKFAMEGLGQTLAQEVAPFGIKVINVQPGGLRTDFNGRSLGASERMIEDYADSAHFARRALARSDGKQKGDPVKAADAVLRAVEAEEPPLNLLLGTDAVMMANQRMAALLLDMGRWGPISETIGFDDPAPVA